MTGSTNILELVRRVRSTQEVALKVPLLQHATIVYTTVKWFKHQSLLV